MKLFDYIYEGGKNYIHIGEARNGDYISEMLIHNKIEGFVSARLKSRNDEKFIVCPITGLVPLTQFVEIKKFSGEGVEAFLYSFIRAMRSMEDYLLPPERLIVEPEHIYQNYGKKNEFLWIYGSEETKGREMIHLFEFLLDKIDDRDDRAVNLIYTLYQSCKNYQMMEPEDNSIGMLSMVCEKGKELLSVKQNLLEIQAENRMRMEDGQHEGEKYKLTLDIEEKEIGERRLRHGEEIRNLKKLRDIPFDSREVRVAKPEKSVKKAYFNRPNMDEEEVDPSEKKGKNKGEIKQSRELFSTVKMRDVLKKAWNYLNSDIGSVPESNISLQEEKDSYKLREVKVIKARKEDREDKATTLLTNGMVNSGVYCLKSTESAEENVILTEYPFFIGKAEGDIHLKIEDNTVSRYHCRIDREENVLWITDLGSTNGTFLNGTRLIPFERLKVMEGDNIVVSRKKYIFRFMK